VLLDLKLPNVDGQTVLRRMHADGETKRLPWWFKRRLKTRKLIKRARLGTNSCIRTSVNFLSFTEAVRRLGLYWLLPNEDGARGERKLDGEVSPRIDN